jgi:type II secretory pathway pseudopilin PulG
MNKRQKAILIEFITVIVITAIAVGAMVNFKDWVNRSEAISAMKQLSQVVLKYRKEYGSVPPESYVNEIKKNLKGGVRLGNLKYRAQWIDFDAPPDEILAYAEKRYPSSLLNDGYAVLRLDGRVEWMNKQQFEKLLAHQQSKMEIDMLRR